MRTKDVLAHQRDHGIDGNAYKFVQCDFAYNSNHLEGSTLTHDQTVSIFDRGMVSGTARVDDINEARNHFDLLDFVIDHADEPITSEMVKRMHAILKRATSAERDPYQVVGGFKVFENEIAGTISRTKTALPSEVPGLIDALFQDYESSGHDSQAFLSTMAEFHWRFESIHPFSDGNGRIGRALLFKECLRRDELPIIITEDMRDFYIRGLREFKREPGYLTDTLGFAQDKFEASYMPLIKNYEKAVQLIDSQNDCLAQQEADAERAMSSGTRGDAGEVRGPRSGER